MTGTWWVPGTGATTSSFKSSSPQFMLFSPGTWRPGALQARDLLFHFLLHRRFINFSDFKVFENLKLNGFSNRVFFCKLICILQVIVCDGLLFPANYHIMSNFLDVLDFGKCHANSRHFLVLTAPMTAKSEALKKLALANILPNI